MTLREMQKLRAVRFPVYVAYSRKQNGEWSRRIRLLASFTDEMFRLRFTNQLRHDHPTWIWAHHVDVCRQKVDYANRDARRQAASARKVYIEAMAEVEGEARRLRIAEYGASKTGYIGRSSDNLVRVINREIAWLQWALKQSFSPSDWTTLDNSIPLSVQTLIRAGRELLLRGHLPHAFSKYAL